MSYKSVLTLPGVLLLASCSTTHTVKHEVSPIHITMDINLRVDRQLEQFFAFEQQPAPAGPATQPAAPAANGGGGGGGATGAGAEGR